MCEHEHKLDVWCCIGPLIGEDKELDNKNSIDPSLDLFWCIELRLIWKCKKPNSAIKTFWTINNSIL